MGFDALSIVMGVLIAAIPFTLLTAYAWNVAYKMGTNAGRLLNVRDDVEAFVDSRIPMTATLFAGSTEIGWTGPMPRTVWGFTHLQAKLSGECGEFAEHFGKALRDDPGTLEDFHNGYVKFTPERRKAMLKELGDILWYVTVLARELGSSLLEVMALNVVKLRDRRARGVSKGSGDDR